MSYGVGVELDGSRVFAAADAAVSFHFAAEDLPPPVQLGVGPVALCLCRPNDRIQLVKTFIRHRQGVVVLVFTTTVSYLQRR